ncbi:MAG: Cof-type HAD-IIB family hydrolase [Acholeplasmatales bacterium]|nr:Cof-type HAD-IIB family hydrolase [Acholeplasmatales bacterium]
MKYIFAVDLDGTLLNDKAELNPKTIEYIKNLDKEKYKFVITTGRPYLGMIKFYKQLELDTYVICNSGTSVLLPNSDFKPINHNIEKSLFLAFYNKSLDLLESAIFTDNSICYIYNKQYNNEFFKHIQDGATVIDGDYNKTITDGPSGGLFILKNGCDKKFMENCKEFENKIGVRCWGNFYGCDYYEFYQKGFNKSTSLYDLLNLYDANLDQLVCFGDSINDIEMITMNNNGVCMINGKDELKKFARYITKDDNNNDGVVNFIDEFIKANE